MKTTLNIIFFSILVDILVSKTIKLRFLPPMQPSLARKEYTYKATRHIHPNKTDLYRYNLGYLEIPEYSRDIVRPY